MKILILRVLKHYLIDALFDVAELVAEEKAAESDNTLDDKFVAQLKDNKELLKLAVKEAV